MDTIIPQLLPEGAECDQTTDISDKDISAAEHESNETNKGLFPLMSSKGDSKNGCLVKEQRDEIQTQAQPKDCQLITDKGDKDFNAAIHESIEGDKEIFPLVASKGDYKNDCSVKERKDAPEGHKNQPQEEYKTTQHQSCGGARKEQPMTIYPPVMMLLQQLQVSTMCVLHPDCTVEYFCARHDINCCHVCASNLHQKCYNINKIDENRNMFIEEDIQQIKIFLSTVEKMLLIEATGITKAEQEARDFLLEVKIKNKNDKVFQNAQEKVERNQKKVIKIHTERISVLQNLREHIDDCVKILESKLSSVQQKIAWRAVLKLTQAQVDRSCTTLTSDVLEMKMFIHNEFNTTTFDVSTEPKKSEISGCVSLCSDILDTLFIHLSNKPMVQIGREPFPLISCDISFVASAERSNIQAGKWTHDGTYLQDNTILLCDTDNKQLVKLNENLGFLEKLSVAGKPRGVCVSSDGIKIHVVCDHKKVVSYTLQGPWREVHRFGTERNARGIACHGDRIVTGHKNFVVIYNRAGTEVSRINTSGWSPYPAISRDGRMLYYVDNHAVVCKSMEDVTQEVWRYSTLTLSGPCGIDLDRDSNILIVGYWSHNIHQVSGDGNLKRIAVQTKYMMVPYGLFTNRNNTFCVTSTYGNDKVCLEMYRFDD